MFEKLVKQGRKESAGLTAQLTTWEPFTNKTSEWFDSEWMFGVKDNFDIVIANPPYGIVYDKIYKEILLKLYPTFKRNNDIYIAFYERGLGLLNCNGTLVYISPNTFLNGDYFKSFREKLTQSSKINEVYDFKELHIFKDPTVFVCTLSCSKVDNIEFPYFFNLKVVKEKFEEYENLEVKINSSCDLSLKPTNKIFLKILNLPEIKIMDKLFYVKDVGFNYWTKGKGKKRDGDSIGDRVFYSGEQKNVKDIPYLTGKDIFRYGYCKQSNYLKHNYLDYLNKKIDTLRFSSEFLEITPKIIYRQTANKIIAALDFDGQYLNKTVHLIVPKPIFWKFDLRYILALLNSKLFNYLYNYISQERKGRVFAQVKTIYIKQLPIKKVTNEQEPIVELVNKIMKIKENIKKLNDPGKQSEIQKYMMKIDQYIYEIYKLTPEEIKIIENSSVN
jgi:adenine-specific DNA-methyltransferase